MEGKEVLMIELTPEQRQALAGGEHRVRDPATNATYVLVSQELFQRVQELLYDASPWTDEEMDLLAEEAGELLDRYQP
jgi:hypothetical protein